MRKTVVKELKVGDFFTAEEIPGLTQDWTDRAFSLPQEILEISSWRDDISGLSFSKEDGQIFMRFESIKELVINGGSGWIYLDKDTGCNIYDKEEVDLILLSK